MDTQFKPRAKESAAQLSSPDPIADIDLSDERIAWMFEPEGNQWPLSRMSHYDMMRLRLVSNYLKAPITQIIQMATEEFVIRKIDELNCEEKLKERLSSYRENNRNY